ncbi:MULTISPECIES: cell division protein FtsL [Pseudoalteromonas]|jgi:cell division protein FtsL|uniref:Cell division protein FtsL n=2 Tax=Pseudoalteromonas aliena TaxID=247523 RepID=A0A1Q2GW01_9GAMM|nr:MULTISPECIES: cell division protein FtsL [Pseudoalteromonas]AQP99291.1 cell division protein FtsL [Pseudoalteromonas aliena]MBE0360723.1 cell division protein FtsL [Pseudoalteromonas aliena SW19]TMO05704.1 cell division protein FtsL [Pseudoalteromonas sp. S558]
MSKKANHRQPPNLFFEIVKGLGANALTSALLVVIFASCFTVVQITHLSRGELIKQDMLLQERDELDLEWRYLLVEEEFYSQHARIEEVAISQLKMKRPTSQDEQVIILQ